MFGVQFSSGVFMGHSFANDCCNMWLRTSVYWHAAVDGIVCMWCLSCSRMVQTVQRVVLDFLPSSTDVVVSDPPLLCPVVLPVT